MESAPTRGPWIEIAVYAANAGAESSAPTRGPWIEMVIRKHGPIIAIVGPHTGAVD